ncbi:MAG TPA: hypothetical protein PL045_07825, partial [Chitinophagaceae bacterium]|nr:hypothetical protein [Chitinophagaceae bacterium]
DALNVLVGKSAKDFSSASEELEFAYRVGRIYDDMGRDNEAVQMYLLAIKLGKGSTEYYASRAALQIGLIYETQNKKDLAVQYYNECLGMKGHDYKDSIDQKAKAGIARCKGT